MPLPHIPVVCTRVNPPCFVPHTTWYDVIPRYQNWGDVSPNLPKRILKIAIPTYPHHLSNNTTYGPRIAHGSDKLGCFDVNHQRGTLHDKCVYSVIPLDSHHVTLPSICWGLQKELQNPCANDEERGRWIRWCETDKVWGLEPKSSASDGNSGRGDWC